MSQSKKTVKTFICEYCGKEYSRSGKQKYHCCSVECSRKIYNRIQRQKKQRERDERLVGVENEDYVVCQECGCKMTQIGYSHLRAYHNMSVSEYKMIYPNAIITASNYIKENLVGDNNPASHSNRSDEDIRKSSPFCKEFYAKRSIDESHRDTFIQTVKDKKTPESYNVNLAFYLARGFSEKEAKDALHERQQTFTLEKCIARYGEYEGKRKYLERQEKWIANVVKTKKSNASYCISSVSQRFIEDVLQSNKYDLNYKYGKNELCIRGVSHAYKYDLTNTNNKHIIEFNGDLWHGNPNKYSDNDKNKINKKLYLDIRAYDAEKIKTAEENGYKVLVIWEYDYYHNKDEVINIARTFLNEEITK